MNRRQRARQHDRRKAHCAPPKLTKAQHVALERRERAIANMEGMTLPALRDWASSLDISVKKKWRKRELIDYIAVEIRKQPLKVEV